MPKIFGGCLCGSIRYETDAEPLQTAICHCSNCQKQSGSAYSVVVAFPKGALQISGSEPSSFTDAGDSGGKVDRLFCPKCGSPLFTRAEFSPDVEFIKAGSLDDTSWLEPDAEYWCSREQEWLKGGRSWPREDGNPK